MNMSSLYMMKFFTRIFLSAFLHDTFSLFLFCFSVSYFSFNEITGISIRLDQEGLDSRFDNVAEIYLHYSETSRTI